jgi:ABC-2 type transport system ATP-binding protein
MPSLTVTGLTRQYAGHGGVVDLTFTLAAGTITALVGANGAGKTTALSVLAGFRLADSGTLAMGGLTIPLTAASARPNMGFVADRPVTDGRLTAWHWLDFVRALRGGTIDTATAAELAEHLCLTPTDLVQPIGSRSFGTQRKIALWVELLVTTDVLLLDEPLTGLDPLAINGLHAALRAFTARGGRVLLSTHLLREAEALASHVIILAHGRIVANAAMADVIGDSSLYEAFLRLADPAVRGAGA